MKPQVTILSDSVNGAKESQLAKILKQIKCWLTRKPYSVSRQSRLTTYLLGNFPKCLLAELNTHRMLSRNAASSRAIPIAKLTSQILEQPFVPSWTSHAKGMVGVALDLESETAAEATKIWLEARDNAVASAEKLNQLGIAKQNANRLLEPWMTVPVIVSGTEWDNFFKLRTAADAQPEFREFALLMQQNMQKSEPSVLMPGQWHVPLANNAVSSAARCARGSYGSFTGESTYDKDVELHDRLAESGHWSPFEHQAMALPVGSRKFTANFRGWQQYRGQLSL
jgi:thymidylate synthase ThyX